MEGRKKHNDFRLSLRRRVCKVEKPALLNVFFCPAWFFKGWWIYVKTIDGEYAVNFKTKNARELESQCFKIFPLGIIGEFNYDGWCEEFYKRYKVQPRDFDRQKTAFARVKVVIENRMITEIKGY